MKQVDIHEGLDGTLMILQHGLKEKPDLIATTSGCLCSFDTAGVQSFLFGTVHRRTDYIYWIERLIG